MTLKLKTESKRRSILSVAAKYNFDEKHALFVEEAALMIFDLLRERFDMSEEDRTLLSHASLLHDVGSFINPRKHHKYSKYIIEHDESLNLYSSRKKWLLSLIAFNHRKKLHKRTLLLPKRSRATVVMLSAILRVADALDHTREDINVISMDCTASELLIVIDGVLPERLAGRLNVKKELFKEIFNMDVILQG